MKSVVAVMLAVAILGACSTSRIDPVAGPRVGADSVIDHTILERSNAKGVVRVSRDSGAYGSGLDVLIYVDGRHVANMESNSVLVMNLPVGTHRVGMQVDNSTAKFQQLQVSVTRGSTKDLRVSLSSGEWTISQE